MTTQLAVKTHTNVDRIVMAFAACMVLLSLGLAVAYSPYWLILAALVALNLLQSSFTGFCPLAIALKKWGVRPGAAFD